MDTLGLDIFGNETANNKARFIVCLTFYHVHIWALYRRFEFIPIASCLWSWFLTLFGRQPLQLNTNFSCWSRRQSTQLFPSTTNAANLQKRNFNADVEDHFCWSASDDDYSVLLIRYRVLLTFSFRYWTSRIFSWNVASKYNQATTRVLWLDGWRPSNGQTDNIVVCWKKAMRVILTRVCCCLVRFSMSPEANSNWTIIGGTPSVCCCRTCGRVTIYEDVSGIFGNLLFVQHWLIIIHN